MFECFMHSSCEERRNHLVLNIYSVDIFVDILRFDFFDADTYQLLEKRGLRYHSQHLILRTQRSIMILQQETTEQKYTGLIFCTP